MARVRLVEILNFRGIKEFSWCPSPGLNCLIGAGDSGKSTILDAIDFCLGARRSIQFTDADFHGIDITTPINISVTLGDLDDSLKNLDSYGMYLRGFDKTSGKLEDEPERGTETVLTLRLTVANDLEPSWSLVSERAVAQGQTRNLSWADRVRLAPTWIGVMADYHLGWRQSSVLNRVSEERAEASAALAQAARHARAAFGQEMQGQLGQTLRIVATTAKELGISVGENLKAMLDAHSVSLGSGAISLHDQDGIPLRGLGVGSTRLLIAGLQRKSVTRAPIILMDELEYGLEPHRIIRLLDSLGAKEKTAPLQVFMTTHSPVALRELSGNQLFVLRPREGMHEALLVGAADNVQSAIRLYPEAFLARSVVVCEGATEVGFLRGIDQYRAANGYESISAKGVSLVDCGGGNADRPFGRATTFETLGYRTAILRDDDKKPTKATEEAYELCGGTVFACAQGRALEDELFLSLSDDGVNKLLSRAVALHGETLINEHIKSVSENTKDLNAMRFESLVDGITSDSRAILGRAARTRNAGWFKSITWMEDTARDIVAPDLPHADAAFRANVEEIFSWTNDAGR